MSHRCVDPKPHEIPARMLYQACLAPLPVTIKSAQQLCTLELQSGTCTLMDHYEVTL